MTQYEKMKKTVLDTISSEELIDEILKRFESSLVVFRRNDGSCGSRFHGDGVVVLGLIELAKPCVSDAMDTEYGKDE